MKPFDDMDSPPPPPRWWTGLVLIGIIYLIAMLITLCRAEPVALEWEASEGSDVAGYMMFRVNGAPELLGTTSLTEITVEASPGDLLGVKALNDLGILSPFSNIVEIDPQALTPPMDRAGWVPKVSSEEIVREDNSAARAIDGDDDTFWHSEWATPTSPPHYLQITLPEAAMVSALYYLTRQDGHPNGRILRYEIESSIDGTEWQAWDEGSWADDMLWKTAVLPLREVRHVRIWAAAQYMAVAEIRLVGSYVPRPPMVTLTVQRGSDLLGWEDFQKFTTPKTDREFYRIKIETP